MNTWELCTQICLSNGWIQTNSQNREHTHTYTHIGEHLWTHTDSVIAPWLPSKWFVSRDPSYSTGLNKSHQVGSDSSYVNVAPNVIWRLGEHGIGPSSSLHCTPSFCDVILSLDDSVLAHFLFHTHIDTLTCIYTKQSKTHFGTQCWLTYYLSLQSGGHQFSPPRVCFVLHVPFPLHTPVIPLVTAVIVMHPCLKSCQRFLTHTYTHTHKNDKTHINKLMYMLTHTTSRPSCAYCFNILAFLSTCLFVSLWKYAVCIFFGLFIKCHKPTVVLEKQVALERSPLF